MIYQLKLPELTLKCLTDVIYLQMSFLRYASSRTKLEQQSCEKYFTRHKLFHGRHLLIAKWLWSKKRIKTLQLLEKFAQGSTEDKRKWSKQLHQEALAFLQNPVGSIMPNTIKPTTEWQIAGTEFLIKFYDDFTSLHLNSYPNSATPKNKVFILR